MLFVPRREQGLVFCEVFRAKVTFLLISLECFAVFELFCMSLVCVCFQESLLQVGDMGAFRDRIARRHLNYAVDESDNG